MTLTGNTELVLFATLGSGVVSGLVVTGAQAFVRRGERASEVRDATPIQQQEMFELASQELSSRAISERVFGDVRFYKRAQRFLNR